MGKKILGEIPRCFRLRPLPPDQRINREPIRLAKRFQRLPARLGIPIRVQHHRPASGRKHPAPERILFAVAALGGHDKSRDSLTLRMRFRPQESIQNQCLRQWRSRSEEHTSELQSLAYLVCRLLLEKKKKKL